MTKSLFDKLNGQLMESIVFDKYSTMINFSENSSIVIYSSIKINYFSDGGDFENKIQSIEFDETEEKLIIKSKYMMVEIEKSEDATESVVANLNGRHVVF